MTASYYDVRVTLYPAPRGAGVAGPPIVKKLLSLGGIFDCYISATNYTNSGPLAKATFLAIQQTYIHITSYNDEGNPQLARHWRFLSMKNGVPMVTQSCES